MTHDQKEYSVITPETKGKYTTYTVITLDTKGKYNIITLDTKGKHYNNT